RPRRFRRRRDAAARQRQARRQASGLLHTADLARQDQRHRRQLLSGAEAADFDGIELAAREPISRPAAPLEYDECAFEQSHRHCERSEAIQRLTQSWIASSLSLLAMTS